jgi:hypothetical protein
MKRVAILSVFSLCGREIREPAEDASGHPSKPADELVPRLFVGLSAPPK